MSMMGYLSKIHPLEKNECSPFFKSDSKEDTEYQYKDVLDDEEADEAFESLLPSPQLEPASAPQELILDIYAEKQSHINKCIRDLDDELARAVTTMVWRDKLSYKDDKH